MSKANPEVDAFLGRSDKWRVEFEALRAIIREFPLAEHLKWGVPCYTFDDVNVVLMHGFKEYCALLFFKGALFRQHTDILIQQSENTQAARQIRFTGARQIAEMTPVLRECIQEAIDVEKAGLKVEFKETAEYAVPEEFQGQLDAMPGLKAAFDALTPGRQRGYLLHFSTPKQSKTRQSRVEKCVPRILEGKGLND